MSTRHPLTTLFAHWSCLVFVSLFSELGAREEIRAVLQSVETSLPFLHAIWGQFVLWVASPGVSRLTMGKRRGSAAVGRERERSSAKKTVLMECLFGAESHTQRQFI